MEPHLYLFVDGSNERMALAYQRMPDKVRNETVWCRTAEEAIDILGNYNTELKLVSLDHDLNEFVQGDTRREDSGMEVIRWLLKQDYEQFKHIEFIAHGFNSSNKKLVTRLQKAGYKAVWKRFGE